MRTFLAKADELIAHVDSNSGRLEARRGQIEFTEVVARDRYNALQSDLQRLQQAALKPR